MWGDGNVFFLFCLELIKLEKFFSIIDETICLFCFFPNYWFLFDLIMNLLILLLLRIIRNGYLLESRWNKKPKKIILLILILVYPNNTTCSCIITPLPFILFSLTAYRIVSITKLLTYSLIPVHFRMFICSISISDTKNVLKTLMYTLKTN